MTRCSPKLSAVLVCTLLSLTGALLAPGVYSCGSVASSHTVLAPGFHPALYSSETGPPSVTSRSNDSKCNGFSSWSPYTSSPRLSKQVAISPFETLLYESQESTLTCFCSHTSLLGWPCVPSGVPQSWSWAPLVCNGNDSWIYYNWTAIPKRTTPGSHLPGAPAPCVQVSPGPVSVNIPPLPTHAAQAWEHVRSTWGSCKDYHPWASHSEVLMRLDGKQG